MHGLARLNSEDCRLGRINVPYGQLEAAAAGLKPVLDQDSKVNQVDSCVAPIQVCSVTIGWYYTISSKPVLGDQEPVTHVDSAAAIYVSAVAVSADPHD